MIKPLADRILVKPIPNTEVSKGGIFTGTPTTTFVQNKINGKATQQTVGKVIAIGPGKWGKNARRCPDVPIGSYVAFSDTCGREVEYENEKYLFIRESDVAFIMPSALDVEHVYRSDYAD